MKYLETPNLTGLTQELTNAICGTRIINGRVEMYSCKRTVSDKKYAHDLAERYNSEAKESRKAPTRRSSTTSSPFGNMQESSVRRLMTDLILTLNASFLDYDFGNVKPGDFRRIPSTKVAMNRTNQLLSELARQKHPSFLNFMWKSIDDAITLKDCQVYSFQSEEDGDEGADPFVTQTPPLMDSFLDDSHEHEQKLGAALWSFNFLFVNKHKKRILFFTCMQSWLKEDFSDEEDYDMYSPVAVTEDATYDSFDIDDEDGYGGFSMDVDAVDQPAISIPNA